MAADLGCSMETIMAHYMSNHIAVAYGDIFGEMVGLASRSGSRCGSCRHNPCRLDPS